MASIKWEQPPVDGDWNTASNWVPAQVPTIGDSASLPGSTAYTVTSSQDNTIAQLQMSKKATLDVNAGVFWVTAGAQSGLAGAINVADDATLELGTDQTTAPPHKGPLISTFSNGGTITLLSGADPTELMISDYVTIIGNGDIVLSGTNDQIVSTNFASTLDNSNNTISGVGTIGSANLYFINGPRGVVDANDMSGGELIIDTNFASAGKMEASNAGVLLFESGGAINSAGIVETLDAGSYVELDSATLNGGKYSIIAGSFLNSVGGSSEINSTKKIENAGQIGAEGGDLLITGPVDNTGTLDANGHLLDILGKVTGTGSATIENGGTLEFGTTGVGITQDVKFENTGAGTETLEFNAAATNKATHIYDGVISGLSSTSDVIDFAGLAFEGNTTPTVGAFDATNDTTLVSLTEGKDVVSFTLSGDYVVGNFTVSEDGTGGTQITDPPVAAATNTLVQAIASFNTSPGIADIGGNHFAKNNATSDFLAAGGHTHNG